MKAAFLLGRVLFGGFFLYNGINHFLHRKQMAEYARAKGVPQPEAAVLISGVQLTAGGASVLLGYEPKLGAALIPVGHLLDAGLFEVVRQGDLVSRRYGAGEDIPAGVSDAAQLA